MKSLYSFVERYNRISFLCVIAFMMETSVSSFASSPDSIEIQSPPPGTIVMFENAVECTKIENKTVIEVEQYGINDILVDQFEVPIYNFNKDDAVGEIVQQLCDSLTKKMGNSCRLLIPGVFEEEPCTILASIFLTDDILSEIKGVIIQTNYKITVLTEVDEEWTKSVGLIRSNETAIIKPLHHKSFVFEPEFLTYIILQILPNDKVKVPYINFNGMDLDQCSPATIKRFDWINSFR